MKIKSQVIKTAIFFLSLTTLLSLTTRNNTIPSQKQNPSLTPKIQAAILLDVSNSMDGLIDQAKTQLWNMVSVMGKAQCNNVAPQIEIALYEYGRSDNSQIGRAHV